MNLIDILDYDIVNYKQPSMYLIFPHCTFKCDLESGRPICQNSGLAKESYFDIEVPRIIEKYGNNPLTHAIVCGGLEPLDSWEELQSFISEFRQTTSDTIIIYTGYKEDEIREKIEWLSNYKNIIIKFGRFLPNQEPHYDKILGVKLASNNQYAKEIGVK